MYLPPSETSIVRSTLETTINKVDTLKHTIEVMKKALEIVTRSHAHCRCNLCLAVAEAEKVKDL